MPELDGLKEETAYLKLLLGILIVTGISLIGWLLRNFGTASWLLSWRWYHCDSIHRF